MCVEMNESEANNMHFILQQLKLFHIAAIRVQIASLVKYDREKFSNESFSIQCADGIHTSAM